MIGNLIRMIFTIFILQSLIINTFAQEASFRKFQEAKVDTNKKLIKLNTSSQEKQVIGDNNALWTNDVQVGWLYLSNVSFVRSLQNSNDLFAAYESQNSDGQCKETVIYVSRNNGELWQQFGGIIMGASHPSLVATPDYLFVTFARNSNIYSRRYSYNSANYAEFKVSEAPENELYPHAATDAHEYPSAYWIYFVWSRDFGIFGKDIMFYAIDKNGTETQATVDIAGPEPWDWSPYESPKVSFSKSNGNYVHVTYFRPDLAKVFYRRGASYGGSWEVAKELGIGTYPHINAMGHRLIVIWDNNDRISYCYSSSGGEYWSNVYYRYNIRYPKAALSNGKWHYVCFNTSNNKIRYYHTADPASSWQYNDISDMNVNSAWPECLAIIADNDNDAGILWKKSHAGGLWFDASWRQKPKISRSPNSLSNSCQQGSNAPDQYFEVWNSGGGTLSYSITCDRTWLSCNPAEGTSTGEHDQISVQYNTSGLNAGDYTATITISDPNASNNPQTISVSLKVTQKPKISRSPSSLSNSCQQGSNAPDQYFEVWNSGGGILSYFITDNGTWLSCNPTSGTSTGEHDQITVQYNTSVLNAGDYTATITISNPFINPQTISVSLKVTQRPRISFWPSYLSNSCLEGTNAPSQTFEVWNSGGGTLTYYISENKTWLSCNPPNGTSTGEHDQITVQYNTSALKEGDYSATITITDPNASNNPQTLPVSLKVKPKPVELSSFLADVRENTVELCWTTASETNNFGFEILRSCDNNSFETIGFVKGHGTTSVPQRYSYIDRNIKVGTYYYKLKQIDIDGSFEYSEIVEAIVNKPQTFELSQNHPNPFNASTVINFNLPKTTNVKLIVYNIQGEQIEELINAIYDAGCHEVIVNAANLPSGMFFYKIEADGFVAVKKFIVLK